CRSFPSALSPALYSYPLSLHDALPILAKSPSTAGRRPASKQEDRFVLRLPREYHEQLAVISRRNRRSMNAEITLLLEQFVAEKRSEEHTSELQSRENLVCRLLLEKKRR